MVAVPLRRENEIIGALIVRRKTKGALPAATVTLLGGRQSARTLHFLVTLALVAFLIVHVAMVWFAGFGTRVTAMITGASTRGSE